MDRGIKNHKMIKVIDFKAVKCVYSITIVNPRDTKIDALKKRQTLPLKCNSLCVGLDQSSAN